ncbi:hypothetical protein H5410_023939 [Solanum commersonii]|uniref:Uncharacterized protein n=1 Tax=Solanum commersonii TaxID=4109 RepID=A0A9J5ZKK0_SOLCO|nr:hypothetical protein H5410_023939 [Solanum commersonii]
MTPYQQCPPLSPYYILPTQPRVQRYPCSPPRQHQNRIVDLGASHHMICNPHLLHHKGQIDNAGHVQMPTGTSAKVSHIGDCHIGGWM